MIRPLKWGTQSFWIFAIKLLYLLIYNMINHELYNTDVLINNNKIII